MKTMKIISFLTAFSLLFSLAACGTGSGSSDTVNTPSPSPSASNSAPAASPSQSATPTPSQSAPVTDADPLHFTVLSGPTGVGAAKLLSDVDTGAEDGYKYTIAAANDEVVSMLSSGETDIAAMASNAALNLYNKTNGSVTVIALGTLGVLHIMESSGGTSIQSVKDLAGKTILAPGQGSNPEYILRYVLSSNGLDPDKDVTLEFYSDASQILPQLISGKAECAMLPVPAATTVIAKSNGSVRAALDLTKEWNALNTGSQLVMTAVVARTEYLKENPAAVDAFLEDYAASIDYVNENVDAAAELVAGYGFAASAPIAAKAIPQCNLVCITGADMAPAIDGYYGVLFEANPKSVGGSLPDDAFYYVP